MSDPGRKDISDQVEETITPDSQKSTLDKVTESVTSAGDRVAASLQPGDSKSTTQKLSDETRSTSDSAEDTGKTYLQQASDFVSGVLDTTQKSVNDLANSISGQNK